MLSVACPALASSCWPAGLAAGWLVRLPGWLLANGGWFAEVAAWLDVWWAGCLAAEAAAERGPNQNS